MIIGWSSLKKVRTALPKGCVALQNDSLDMGSWFVAGARGWDYPQQKESAGETQKIYQRN